MVEGRTAARAGALEELTRRVRAIERGRVAGRPEPPPLATAWEVLDRTCGGGLARGSVHEWLGLDDAAGAERMRGGLAAWTPPLFQLMALCRRALEQAAEVGRPGWVVWIGSRVWPYPRALAGDLELEVRGGAPDAPSGGARFESSLGRAPERGAGAPTALLLDRSLFVDPPDLEARVWAADGALRCPSVAAVVVDGRGLRMPAARRLQLAAEAGGGLGLIARPADEVREPSAAATRWRVRRGAPCGESPSERATVEALERPRWELELVRLKRPGVDSRMSQAHPSSDVELSSRPPAAEAG